MWLHPYFRRDIAMQKKLLMHLMLASLVLVVLGTVASAQIIGQIQPSGTTSMGASQMGMGAGTMEIDPAFGSDSDVANDAVNGVAINRSIAKTHGIGVGVSGGPKFKSNPSLVQSFNGLNMYDQRYANNGNQFTIEPPDQALCVGNGFVLESVNDVLRVFDTAGNALTGAVDLNTFYGYPAALNRANAPNYVYGPSITDPICYFDTQTQRFYHVVLTLDRKSPTGSALQGTNHLDIAVSDTSNPLGTWTIYKIDASNNGQNGTPNHHCSRGYCLGDYPHLGADAYGFYITTNEFSTLGGGFYGAQIYAMSKRALASHGPVSVFLFNTMDYLDADGIPGFTVWPAISAPGQFVTDNGGTEFFLNSDAVFMESGFSNRLRQWALTNTSSLDSVAPALTLTSKYVATIGYGVPPRATQKSGDHPYGQSIGKAVGVLDANDSRTQQVYYANGKLWTAVDTGVTYDGINVLAGVAYFVINPNSGKPTTQGYVAVPNNHITYPAVAATADGRGAMAFTIVGPDFFPSAGYASLDAVAGIGEVKFAAPGVGPQDGFSEYQAYYSDGSPRPRWGDYGAAAVDGNSIWIASEYIGQTCTLAQWTADFTCGGTRGSQANWGTRISQLKMK
jgi:hypothetical protein